MQQNIRILTTTQTRLVIIFVIALHDRQCMRPVCVVLHSRKEEKIFQQVKMHCCHTASIRLGSGISNSREEH